MNKTYQQRLQFLCQERCNEITAGPDLSLTQYFLIHYCSTQDWCCEISSSCLCCGCFVSLFSPWLVSETPSSSLLMSGWCFWVLALYLKCGAWQSEHTVLSLFISSVCWHGHVFASVIDIAYFHRAYSHTPCRLGWTGKFVKTDLSAAARLLPWVVYTNLQTASERQRH